MGIDQSWLNLLEALKEKTACPVDLNVYFDSEEIVGKKMAVFCIGECSVPSGKLLVRDPLVYLSERGAKPYFENVKAGVYRIEVSVVRCDDVDCDRYAAVRVRFSDARAVRFYEALVGDEDLQGLEEGEGLYFGFNVDAGLGCICDEVVHGIFCDWHESWHKLHPEGNLYNDYFEALFARSYEEHPEFQRDGGDWLNWEVPGTSYHLPIFQSGFGDGVYPVYWGVDESGEICQLVCSSLMLL